MNEVEPSQVHWNTKEPEFNPHKWFYSELQSKQEGESELSPAHLQMKMN